MNIEDKEPKDQPTLVQLVSITSPRSAMAEAYRTLRTNLGFTAIDKPFRSVMVTSAAARDGKSTVIANLAVVTAQAGNKVLLVDCDLRKPVQHKLFQLSNQYGFTNCILYQMDTAKAAQSIAGADMNNLKILTCGPIPPNPAEILNSDRTRQWWGQLADQYDYIFVDSPPVLEVSDASILASQLDAVMLVLRYGITRMDIAKQVQEQLGRANARLIGAVINQVKSGAEQYYSYY